MTDQPWTIPATPAALAEAKALAEADRLWRIEQGRDNLFWFGRYYFPHYFEDATPDFHWEFADLATWATLPLAQRGTNGMIVATPRGHAKSTIFTFLVILHWICYKKKEFVVIVSETTTMAEKFAVNIREELETNEVLREDFGDLCGDTAAGRPLKWTTKDFTAAHKDDQGRPTFRTRILARGTGAQFRGLRSKAQRPDAIICDDLESDVHVRTPEQRQKTWDWFNRVVMPALDPTRGVVIVVGTVLHFDSLLQKLLKQAKEGLYKSRFFQAIAPDGKILWPARFSREWLDSYKRRAGAMAFNSEYQNIPIDEDARLYRPEWPRWYNRNELEHRPGKGWHWRGEPLEIYIGVDPAIEENTESDYFATVVLGLCRKQKAWLVLWCWQQKIGFPEQVQEIIRLEATWQPERVGIERNAYQRALIQQAIKESPNPVPRFKALLNRAHKYTRILSASLPWENGQVWLRESLADEAGEDVDGLGQRRVHPHVAELYRQALEYPNSAHEDLLDAMENAFQVAKLKGKKAFSSYRDKKNAADDDDEGDDDE